jgi:hypothetical protein
MLMGCSNSYNGTSASFQPMASDFLSLQLTLMVMVSDLIK